jgi:hypothetical protein
MSGAHPGIISVDDHLIEPPNLFEGRMPAALVERAPRIVELGEGKQAWEYEGNFYANVGLNAVIGRPKDEWSMEPARFEEMRSGCYDIHERIKEYVARRRRRCTSHPYLTTSSPSTPAPVGASISVPESLPCSATLASVTPKA